MAAYLHKLLELGPHISLVSGSTGTEVGGPCYARHKKVTPKVCLMQLWFTFTRVTAFFCSQTLSCLWKVGHRLVEQAGGGAKTQPITPAGLERPEPCLGDQDHQWRTMPRVLQALQEASWLPPFLGGDSAGWWSRRRPGFEGEAHIGPRNTCPTVMANTVSLLIPEWREQEVNNETAQLFPTAHTVPL